MRKVGIVTYWTPDNYGAVLQAYALQTVVSRLGFDCEIVNYVCKARRKKPRFQIPRNPVNMLRNIKVALEKHYRVPQKRDGFRRFRERFLKLTPHYDVASEIDTSCFSALIAGSDQIWNPNINEWDSAYWLAFASGGKLRKIAYAPSFGRAALTDAQKREYAEYLKDFQSVSCRETDGVALIRSELGRPDAVQTIDPTLLLDVGDYEKCREEYAGRPERYVLCFHVGVVNAGNPLFAIARDVSRRLGLPVITVSNEVYSRSFFPPRFISPSPGEALDLIKNAAFVVTNSFHGMVFSIQYGREVLVYTGSQRENRVATLLEMCGIGERLLVEYRSGDFLPINDAIDYGRVKDVLCKSRVDSMSFLKTALDPCRA